MNKNESGLEDHTQNKKKLNPPFLSNGLENMTTSSWFDERLPELLWAIVVIGNIERNTALDYFRYIAKYVEANQECFNVLLTGISKINNEQQEKFIKHFTEYSENINNVLRILLLFPELPSYKYWEKYLPKPKPDEDWNKLNIGVSKTFWHQSEEATDCRWVRVLCMIVGGKMKFTHKMEDSIRGILEYPNYGDLRSVRPSIRASEMVPDPGQKIGSSKWAKHFWKHCFNYTGCIPEEAVNKKLQKRQKNLSYELENTRNHYFEETKRVRNNLVDHFFNTAKESSIDSRHEGSFGLALYGLSLLIEINFYRTALSITSRLGLRALVETLITFTYLLKKEKDEPRVWDDYRTYGVGQIKLIYLKLKDDSNLSSIEIDEMDHIANEDKWIEFTPINLGHWDSANLRKMSEEVGLKDIYDKYYAYTSGFMHGAWGAVRESIYQKCFNSLHRYHRVPTYDLPLMPSTTIDAINILNDILNCLSKAYPEFNDRVAKAKKIMPNVILVHGKDTDPTQKWYPWLKNEVEKKNIKFFAPKLPKAEDPILDEWLSEIENLHPDKNSILIGHSRGGVAILRWLEKQKKDVKVKKVILVATNNPAVSEKNQAKDTHGFYELGKYNFEKIKKHCDNFVVLHSEDDEWVPFLAGEENAKGLNAKFLKFKNRGHFGKKLPKSEIPELLDEIL